MPRFGTKTLLIVCVIVAVWLSTFSGYLVADDVRRSILLTVFVLAGIAAIFGRARQRAFWAGFFAVLFVMATPAYGDPVRLEPYLVKFWWASELTWKWAGSPSDKDVYGQALKQAFSDTIWAAWTLGLATCVGFLSAKVYDSLHKHTDAA